MTLQMLLNLTSVDEEDYFFFNKKKSQFRVFTSSITGLINLEKDRSNNWSYEPDLCETWVVDGNYFHEIEKNIIIFRYFLEYMSEDIEMNEEKLIKLINLVMELVKLHKK